MQNLNKYIPFFYVRWCFGSWLDTLVFSSSLKSFKSSSTDSSSKSDMSESEGKSKINCAASSPILKWMMLVIRIGQKSTDIWFKWYFSACIIHTLYSTDLSLEIMTMKSSSVSYDICAYSTDLLILKRVQIWNPWDENQNLTQKQHKLWPATRDGC